MNRAKTKTISERLHKLLSSSSALQDCTASVTEQNGMNGVFLNVIKDVIFELFQLSLSSFQFAHGEYVLTCRTSASQLHSRSVIKCVDRYFVLLFVPSCLW